jgi:hypothetical protein
MADNIIVYWHGNFNSPDPSHMIDMENKVFVNTPEESDDESENNEGFVGFKIGRGITEIWVAMLYCYDIGETIIVDSNKDTLLLSFIDHTFGLIRECTLDDIDKDVFNKYNFSKNIYGTEAYFNYLKDHQLEMVYSKESLISYFQNHDTLVLKVPSGLLPAEIVIKHVTVEY